MSPFPVVFHHYPTTYKTMKHRYQQEALAAVPGAEPRSYSPKPLQLAPPEQGWLALDGAVLGPLFDLAKEES